MSRRSTIMVQRSYYQIGVVTLATALMWVGVSVYQGLVGTADVGVDPALLTPLNPIIDETTIASISARNQVSVGAVDLVKTVIATPAASPAVEVEQTEESVEEPVEIDLIETEVATDAGTTEPAPQSDI